MVAHEIGHHAANHVARGTSNQMIGALIGVAVVGLAGALAGSSAGADATRSAAQLGARIGHLSFSKEQEREADYMAALILYRAGVDLDKARGLLVNMAARSGLMATTFLDSHPAGPERARLGRAADPRVNGRLPSGHPATYAAEQLVAEPTVRSRVRLLLLELEGTQSAEPWRRRRRS